ncbi:MAG: Rieske 2Fe-2S domain-containing protein [Alphaproteobacteria bacterium]|nr:Rieske 2Fe-2S domain-containing protein [Alphaproteobacteria bacterium]
MFPPGWRVLGKVSDITDGGSAGYEPAKGAFNGLLAVRRGDDVKVYVNSCPHIGAPLDWVPGRFLSLDGTRIICALHGAEFEIDTGFCLSGPCHGDRLDPVMIQIKDGMLLVPEDAGV